ncbi:MAG: transketolase family protein [Caldisericia bacterium]|nr:transketolase family protein [Caldisericia bacterium]
MEKKATRFGYSDALMDMAKTDDRIVVLDADLSKSTTTVGFHKKYPKRSYNIGIAEQNMLGSAAGLSLTGKIPYVSTYGVFVSGRAYDQIRTTICYSNLNVKIGGAHGGISVGPDGATHQALEEIGLMRGLPNMTVIVPCDYHETYKATKASASIPGPVYIRFGREAIPIVTKPDTPFVLGKGQVYKDGRDVSIIACGSLVYEALVAAESLKTEGIHCKVINIHTIKPMDKELIIKSAQETGAIVTAEEHQIMTGFGSAISEVIVQNCPVPIEMVGINDTFGESGTPDELMEAYHLTSNDIIEKVKKVIKRKKS